MIDLSIFNYKNGVLTWAINPSSKVFAGDVAGTIVDGYVKVMYKKRSYGAHRIVWEMHKGKIPYGFEVDHINHIRSDNRIENLRIVSRSENMLNKSIYSTNKSGVVGVSWNNKRGKWIAQIQKAGKKKSLYEGDSFDDACKARRSAENGLLFHENHGVLNENR